MEVNLSTCLKLVWFCGEAHPFYLLHSEPEIWCLHPILINLLVTKLHLDIISSDYCLWPCSLFSEMWLFKRSLFARQFSYCLNIVFTPCSYICIFIFSHIKSDIIWLHKGLYQWSSFSIFSVSPPFTLQSLSYVILCVFFPVTKKKC